MSLEGKIQIQSTIVPANDNPRMPVTDVVYVKGAGQTFATIQELVDFHPNRMSKGMTATVLAWPSAGQTSKFILNIDPVLLLDANNDSILTLNNFSQFWDIETQTQNSQVRVTQYAPDSSGGGAPIYPYTIGQEPNWTNTLDYSKGHKWMRFRDDDVDGNLDGIFDNWTSPIAILNAFQSGDYVDKRFKREGTPASFNSVATSEGGMTADYYYVVDKDSVEISGDLSLNDIGEYGTNTVAVLTTGRVFKYAAANDYDFTYGGGAAEVRRILKTPPRTVSGVANNEPAGWQDTPPAGTDQLWEISGSKSVYGQLKSEWLLRKIVEDPDFTRYSSSANPHPDNLVDTNTVATAGSPGDDALIAGGWLTAYDSQTFIARRSLTGGSPTYTSWLVEKIAEESGEFVDRVFKLFDINLDSDAPSLLPPTDRDATRQGWSDAPLAETDLQINYVSEARKFFDGTLKTTWSKPVPFTGKDTFSDTIVSSPSDNFKYDVGGAADPTEITLTANLYKGVIEMWKQLGFLIDYTWRIVYDDGAVVNISPTGNTGDDFHIKPIVGSGIADAAGSDTVLIDAAGSFISKGVQIGDKIWNVTDESYATVTNVNSATQLTTTPLIGGTLNVWTSGNTYTLEVDGYVQAGQVVGVKPGAVNGQSVFRCTQTVVMLEGDDLVFEEEISILDVTDGKDAKSLTLTADAPRVIYDTVGLVFSPATLMLRAYWSNIPGITLYWYVNTGTMAVPIWTAIVNGVGGYTISGNILSFAATVIFTSNDTAQEKQYAASNHATNPASADYITTFSDFLTLTKLGAANIGSPGADAVAALLDNEAHTVVLDSGTEQPITGEITSSGKAKTLLQVYDGQVLLDYTTDYTITLSSDNPDIVFAHQAAGTDRLIYISSWLAGERSAVCTINIDYNSNTYIKKFSVASTLDAPGAIVLDIDSDKGFEFTPTDKTNKTLTAKLYDTALAGNQLISLPDATYQFRWNVNGVWGALSQNNYTRVITRSDIQSSSLVTVQVYVDGGATLYRERTISMSDVVDGRAYRAWTLNTPGSSVLTNQDPTTAFSGGFVTIGAVTWRLQSSSYWQSAQPIWSQDALVDPITGLWSWTAPYQIRGEKGDQGLSGNFVYPMYIGRDKVVADDPDITTFAAAAGSGLRGAFKKGSIVSINNLANNIYYYSGADNNAARAIVGNYSALEVKPDFGNGNSDTATLAQMLAEGWTSRPPSVGLIWRTERPWTGEGVTFNSNGDPSTGPVTGGKWTSPVRLSNSDGRAFKGADGSTGWSPKIIVVAGATPGTKVLQLAEWIGGTGSKPAGEGKYLGSSGLVDTTALANPVTGEPVELRYNAPYIEWKYTSQGTWTQLYLSPSPSWVKSGVQWGLASGTILTLSASHDSTHYEIPAVPYRRRLRVLWSGEEVGGNGGTDAIQMHIMCDKDYPSTYLSIGLLQTEFTFTGGSSFHRWQIMGEETIQANDVARIRGRLVPFQGGEYIFRWQLGPTYNGYFYIELTPY